MNRVPGVLLVFVCLAAASVASCGKHSTQQAFGPDVADVVLHPDKVEAFRVVPDHDAGVAGQRIGPARVVSSAGALDAGSAGRWAAALTDPASYQPPVPNGCKFEPGVALRFRKGVASVDVVLCFNCRELKVLHKDGTGKPAAAESRDFGPSAATLTRLAKEAFPRDQEIQDIGRK